MPSQELKDLSIALANPAQDAVSTEEIKPTEPITPDALSSEEVAFEAPTVADDTAIAGELGRLDESEEPVVTPEPTPAEAQRDLFGESLEDYITSVTEGRTRAEMEAEAFAGEGGVDELQRERDIVSHQLRREQHALRRSIEKVMDNPRMTKGMARAKISGLEAASFRKQADLAVIQMGLQGEYDSAKAIADRAVEAQFQQQQLESDMRKFMFELNYDRFTELERREFEQNEKKRDRALEQEKEQGQRRYDLTLQAQLDGAPIEVLREMQAAEDIQGVIEAGGSYIGKLDRLAKNAQIRSSLASANKSEYELGVIKEAEKARLKAIEEGVLTPNQAEKAGKVDDKFRAEPVVKQYNEAVSARFAFESIVEGGTQGVEDIMLVYQFMKSVDPRSVVREAEYDMAQLKSGNWFAGNYARFNGYFKEGGGSLPPNVRSTFLSAANAAFEGKHDQYYNLTNEFGEKVDQQLGLEPGTGKNYLTEYHLAAPGKPLDEARVGQVAEGKDGRKYVVEEGEDGTLQYREI